LLFCFLFFNYSKTMAVLYSVFCILCFVFHSLYFVFCIMY
jgi:hypothetical protein